MSGILVADDKVLTALHGALATSVAGGNDTTVAIVDDDDDVGAVLHGLLELVGYRAVTYRSGRQFLNAPLGHVSCLVVDQSMPEMTGLEVVAQLRAMGLTIPSLLITGCAEEKIGRQALDLGVMKVMEKPLAAGDLLLLIARSVE